MQNILNGGMCVNEDRFHYLFIFTLRIRHGNINKNALPVKLTSSQPVFFI